MRKKKITVIILSSLLTLVLIFAAGGYFLFRNEIRVIGTITKLHNEKNLYSMEYTGDYGFEKFIAEGGASSADKVAAFLIGFISKGFINYSVQAANGGCSTISAVTPEGGLIFGRNFDWIGCSCMIVKTAPINGYKSISTVNLDFLGYNADYQPDNFANSFLALGAPFCPLDGMNEAGLCIADLIVEDAGETHQSTDKPDLTTTTAIRLLLDNAATVDEAVELLKQYDMNSDAGITHHLSISDTSGRSVVVEYINNQMYVTDTPIVTNFFLTEGESYGLGSEESKRRFEILQDIYDRGGGVLNADDVKSALFSVKQSDEFNTLWDTQWSVIFDAASGKATYYHLEDFTQKYEFDIGLR